MAITRGAKKAQRSSLKKRVFNIRRKATLHDVVKEVKGKIKGGDSEGAQSLIPKAYKAIDKAAKRGVIKKNTASRKKSRLMKSLRATTTK